jgi:hypothetical protein
MTAPVFEMYPKRGAAGNCCCFMVKHKSKQIETQSQNFVSPLPLFWCFEFLRIRKNKIQKDNIYGKEKQKYADQKHEKCAE